VKNKTKLTRFNWRASIYFIYERFLYERNLLFKHILNNDSTKLVRKHREINQLSVKSWASSQHRKDLITQVEKENVRISQTYDRLAKKTE